MSRAKTPLVLLSLVLALAITLMYWSYSENTSSSSKQNMSTNGAWTGNSLSNTERSCASYDSIVSDKAKAVEIASSLDIVKYLIERTNVSTRILPYGVSTKTGPHTASLRIIGWCITYRLSSPVWVSNVSYIVSGRNVEETFTGWVMFLTVCVPTRLDNTREKITMVFTHACLPGIPVNASSTVKALVTKAFSVGTNFLARLGHRVIEKRFCHIDSKYVHIELITSKGDRYKMMIDKETMEIKYSAGELRQLPERP